MRRPGRLQRPGHQSANLTASHPTPPRSGGKKGAPLRRCECGKLRENRGIAGKDLLTSLGEVRLQRRWWGNRCACSQVGYLADGVLGLEGRLSLREQKRLCSLAADVSFQKAQEHLQESWPVSLSSESVRL